MPELISPVLPSPQVLEAFCRRHHIRNLSVFGSVARGEAREDSDVDFLVVYEPDHHPDWVALQQIEDDLSQLCGGRRVDMVNPRYLNRHLKDRILAEAVTCYGEG